MDHLLINQFKEAAASFMGTDTIAIEDGPSGMNNTTRRLYVNGNRYIFRIYDTHQDPDKVKFEHEVLAELQGAGLSFAVPAPCRTREGSTIVKLRETGKLAAAFVYIDGERPDFGQPNLAYQFGACAGELQEALKKVGETLLGRLSPSYPPYYELGAAHPLCTLDRVAKFCMEPPAPFASVSAELAYLGQAIEGITHHLERLPQLPHQLIHGDLNSTNALVSSAGSLAALLDFEFTTWDLRVMEPAVCMWSLIRKDTGGTQVRPPEWDSLSAFWKGYCGAVKLLKEELEVLPALIQLRSLDVFVHFLGRYWDGVDPIDVLLGQIPDTASRVQWVAHQEERLRELLRA